MLGGIATDVAVCVDVARSRIVLDASATVSEFGVASIGTDSRGTAVPRPSPMSPTKTEGRAPGRIACAVAAREMNVTASSVSVGVALTVGDGCTPSCGVPDVTKACGGGELAPPTCEKRKNADDATAAARTALPPIPASR